MSVGIQNEPLEAGMSDILVLALLFLALLGAFAKLAALMETVFQSLIDPRRVGESGTIRITSRGRVLRTFSRWRYLRFWRRLLR
jgi:hypothetical protein